MNWNTELLEAIRPKIDGTFGTLIDELCSSLTADLAQQINEVMNHLDQDLRGGLCNPSVMLVLMRSFR